MKIGISSYSLQRAQRDEGLDIGGLIDWAAKHGAEHLEVVPIDPLSVADEATAQAIAQRAKDAGVTLSSYTIAADLQKDGEVERLRREVDIAAALGVGLMRHDAAWLPPEEASDAAFDTALPMLSDGCAAVAAHAKTHGITTSVENHGFFVQGSERVARLIEAVNVDNFRATFDIGNVLCRDEDPVAAARRLAPLTSMLHVKDFFIRADATHLDGWLKTAGGQRLRGAITGCGDIDLRGALREVLAVGYEGFASIEFEGKEPCRDAAIESMANLRQLLAAARSDLAAGAAP